MYNFFADAEDGTIIYMHTLSSSPSSYYPCQYLYRVGDTDTSRRWVTNCQTGTRSCLNSADPDAPSHEQQWALESRDVGTDAELRRRILEQIRLG